jgi:hypothetical protein
MASFEPTGPGLSARDVLALSDADLAQFMERSRRPDGGFDLDVADCHRLPKSQREKLAERLKYWSSLWCFPGYPSYLTDSRIGLVREQPARESKHAQSISTNSRHDC